MHYKSIDLYRLCSILRQAFYGAFTRANIVDPFRRSGVWPVNPSVSMAIPRPINSEVDASTATVEDMKLMLDESRTRARLAITGQEPIVKRRGFVCNTQGVVLKSDAALAAARALSQKYHEKKVAAAARASAREKAAQEKIVRAESARWAMRAQLAHQTVSEMRHGLRPLAVRRATARERAARPRNRAAQMMAAEQLLSLDKQK